MYYGYTYSFLECEKRRKKAGEYGAYAQNSHCSCGQGRWADKC